AFGKHRCNRWRLRSDSRRRFPRYLRRPHSFLPLHFREVHILMRDHLTVALRSLVATAIRGGRRYGALVSALALTALFLLLATKNFSAFAQQPAEEVSLLRGQSEDAAAAKSTGCISCHGP